MIDLSCCSVNTLNSIAYIDYHVQAEGYMI